MKLFLGPIIALIIATPAMSQHSHSDHSNMTDAATAFSATEPGQAGFAAIAEIVEILRSDPATDWSRVDIEALRQHLIDMHLVTLYAQVAVEPNAHGATFSVTGEARVGEAIQAMLPSHAPFLASETGWTVNATKISTGVSMQVLGETDQILGLGFIGLLTIGAHHQEHHLLTARGLGGH